MEKNTLENEARDTLILFGSAIAIPTTVFLLAQIIAYFAN
jgi:hypothetical protein